MKPKIKNKLTILMNQVATSKEDMALVEAIRTKIVELTGVHPLSVRRWERNATQPSIQNAYDIIEAFKLFKKVLKVDDLFTSTAAPAVRNLTQKHHLTR